MLLQMPPPLLLLLLLLGCSCQATHFFGTVATYTPKETHGNGNVTVVLRYKLNFHECTNLRWDCLVGECGNVTEALVHTVQNKADGEWCQTERISTRLAPSNAPFELGITGGDWIDNIVNGIVAWRAVILVELRNRSDTNRANASPQTTILPLLRVPSNCQREFDLPAFDPDGDEVRCRYGSDAAAECNPCTPPSVLTLAPSCTLSFSATNSSSEGPYAVQLVMEDFPRQTITLSQTDGTLTAVTPSDAISKIPIQFVVRVDPAVPSCTDGLYLPRFLPPTPDQGARLYTNVNENLLITVSSEATNSSISELLFSGPHNTVLSSSGTGVFTLSWTPAAEEDGESRPICFVVEALHNITKFHSELRCVIVTVGEAPPSTTTTTTIPPTTTKTSASPSLPPTTTATTASSPTTTVPSTTTAVPPPTATTSTSLPPPTTTGPPLTSTIPTTTTSSVATSSLPPTTTKTSASPTLPPTTTATTASSPTTTVPSTTTAVPPPPTTTTSTSLPPPTTTGPPLTSTTLTTTTSSLATSSLPPTTTKTSATTTATVPPTSTATSTTILSTTAVHLATTNTTSPSLPPSTTTGPPLMSTIPTTTTTSSSTTTTTMVPSTTTTTTALTPTTAITAAPSSSPTVSTQRFPYYVVGLRLRISTSLTLNEQELLDIVQQVSQLLVGDGLQFTVTKYQVVPL